MRQAAARLRDQAVRPNAALRELLRPNELVRRVEAADWVRSRFQLLGGLLRFLVFSDLAPHNASASVGGGPAKVCSQGAHGVVEVETVGGPISGNGFSQMH